MRFREVERILKAHGWVFKNARGSHNYYVHPVLPGKITVPNHTGDLDMRTVKSVFRQAGIGGEYK